MCTSSSICNFFRCRATQFMRNDLYTPNCVSILKRLTRHALYWRTLFRDVKVINAKKKVIYFNVAVFTIERNESQNYWHSNDYSLHPFSLLFFGRVFVEHNEGEQGMVVSSIPTQNTDCKHEINIRKKCKLQTSWKPTTIYSKFHVNCEWMECDDLPMSSIWCHLHRQKFEVE